MTTKTMKPGYVTVLVERDQIKEYADLFLKTWLKYPDCHKLVFGPDISLGERRKALASLDLETCTTTELNQALGTKGWGLLQCTGCGQEKNRLLRLGSEGTHDNEEVALCADCLKTALIAVAAPPQGQPGT